MTAAIVFVVGIGITAAILFLIMYVLDEQKQFFLKLLLMMSIMALMLMMPKAFGDAQQNCEVVVANSTAVNSSFTSYSYTNYCYTDTSTTPSTFMKVIMWIYRLLIGYIIVWLFVMCLKGLYDLRNSRPGGGSNG